MQTKKEDLKADILNAAEREFLVHGYHNGSMRAIARRANTTIGNIYHYFPKKEALLDEIIGSLPTEIASVLRAHQNFSDDSLDPSEITLETVSLYIPELFPMELLLSPRFLIFLAKSEGTKYDLTRERLIRQFNDHLKWHMNLEEDTILTETILQAFLSSLIFISTQMKNIEDGKKHLFEYIRVMSLGFPVFPGQKRT